jgi:hypothetical protein
MGTVSVISLLSSSRLALGFMIGVCRIGGVTDSISCGVQMAGENVNLEDGVDSEERSAEVSCDASDSAIGEVLPVDIRRWSLISCSVLANGWLWASENHGSELCS